MKLAIGFVTYNNQTAKYLPDFLRSLKRQTLVDYKIFAVDNSENEKNENSAYLKQNYPEILINWPGENLGFAKAFNRLIEQAVLQGAEYFLALNPDMIIEPEMAERLLKVIQSDERIGAVQPKILKLDFAAQRKTESVDSYGLSCDRQFRFRDKNQGEIDNRFDGTEEVFGFTGAAVLLNLKALKEISFVQGDKKEYFDELMFMYKEDCDLSLRLRLAGWKILLAYGAVAYHDRTASQATDNFWQIIKHRRKKNRSVKEWSYRGQWLIFFKYINLNFSPSTKLSAGWYQFKVLIYSILFERFLLKELFWLWRKKQIIKDKKANLIIKIDPQEIEQLMA